MNLVAFSIPDDPGLLPGWLERRLVAPDFGRFVAELSAVHPAKGSVPARDLLGDWFPRAVAGGLKGVPAGVLQGLLRHPDSLLELQEAVLTEGGPYWDEVANHIDALTPAVDRGRESLEAALGGSASVTLASPRREPAAADSPRVGPRSYLTWAVVSSALAACLLVAVGFLTLRGNRGGQPVEVAAVGWGWAKPGGIPGTQTRAEYLNGLADAAGEWFQKQPEDAAGVAKRIGEFRLGCSQLILAPHAPLGPDDRKELVRKCQNWARELDQHLTALEAGADPLKVRGDTDRLVEKLQKSLRDQAAKVG